jgi:hypothetical protein
MSFYCSQLHILTSRLKEQDERGRFKRLLNIDGDNKILKDISAKIAKLIVWYQVGDR